ncbi:hypothetical protein JR316_0008612 [Psilocybe cubensis]|uniref:Uncharacterized protein n=2 Tax=Psilocybe cubensis TaxID=181762 RepID=A0A8H7XY77_PSICU|nr:hypothetical protein JR316_0008612 [Psilocybe cubensis]KAH9478159.1 hypothetical protein JR316_0008612 [Psilocybe cubensis]
MSLLKKILAKVRSMPNINDKRQKEAEPYPPLPDSVPPGDIRHLIRDVYSGRYFERMREMEEEWARAPQGTPHPKTMPMLPVPPPAHLPDTPKDSKRRERTMTTTLHPSAIGERDGGRRTRAEREEERQQWQHFQDVGLVR